MLLRKKSSLLRLASFCTSTGKLSISSFSVNRSDILTPGKDFFKCQNLYFCCMVATVSVEAMRFCSTLKKC